MAYKNRYSIIDIVSYRNFWVTDKQVNLLNNVQKTMFGQHKMSVFIDCGGKLSYIIACDRLPFLNLIRTCLLVIFSESQ